MPVMTLLQLLYNLLFYKISTLKSLANTMHHFHIFLSWIVSWVSFVFSFSLVGLEDFHYYFLEIFSDWLHYWVNSVLSVKIWPSFQMLASFQDQGSELKIFFQILIIHEKKKALLKIKMAFCCNVIYENNLWALFAERAGHEICTWEEFNICLM